MRLSDEVMVEIGRVRERLMDFKMKGQPYPMELEPESPEPKVTEVIHRHSDMSKQDFALLRDMEGRVKYLQNKDMEREKKKHKIEPKTYTFNEDALDNHDVKE